MAEPLYTSRTTHVYPTDLLSILLAVLFALGSYINSGKAVVRLAGLPIDREALYGTLFLFIALVLPLLFRWLNPIKSRLVQFFRLFYPQVLYLLFYQEEIRLSHFFYTGRTFDKLFAQADLAIFSFQPSIRFHQPFSGIPAVNELFFFGYFSFFVLMTVGWWMLYSRSQISKAVSTLTIITFSFYVLYIVYALFPVEGPKYYFPSLRLAWYGHFKGYLFTALMKQLFDNVDLAGAAFPSSHVAISTLALALNLRHSPRLGIAFLPITLILWLSTVYLYEHYAVDAFAGLLAAALFLWGVPRLLRALSPTLEACDALLSGLLALPPIAALEPKVRP